MVLARAKHPVVLVRSAAEGDGGEVVVGLQDLGAAADPLLEFAFRAAAARGTVLRAVHARPVVPHS